MAELHAAVGLVILAKRCPSQRIERLKVGAVHGFNDRGDPAAADHEGDHPTDLAPKRRCHLMNECSGPGGYGRAMEYASAARRSISSIGTSS